MARADWVQSSRAPSKAPKRPCSCDDFFASFLLHFSSCQTFNALMLSFWNSTALTCTVLQHMMLVACHSDVKDKHDRLRRSQVSYRFIRLGELVYLVFWGTLLIECVGEETCRLNKRWTEKHPKRHPWKLSVAKYD